ncbi:MAG: hypothetical protein KGR22_03710, partial [Planctomycetes bacterium]|nr:hypothetical protein [Planctomycetota bacterium]
MPSRTIHAALFVGAAAMLAATTRSVDPPSTADGPPSRGTSATPQPAVATPSMDVLKPLDLPGLHNLVAFHDDVWSGSVPEGDAGFDSLTSLGVRTIISVDGALPDLERARARGMRYVHL